MTLLFALLFGCPVVTESYQASIRDNDGDGFDAIGFGGLDCDDLEPEVHPLAEEVWYDEVDDDCDGNTHDQDEDGVLGGPGGPDCDDTDPDVDDQRFDRFFDADGDGYGSVAAVVCPNLPGYADASGDCDDTDDQVHPGQVETWYDAVDDDCDGNTHDQDGDGFPGGDVGSDCDDTDPSVLDGLVFYVDNDDDGYGDPDAPIYGGCLPGTGQADNDLDCNDNDGDVHPAASEVCDDGDVDEDCDGFGDDLDEVGAAPGNQSFFYVDADGDGYGYGDGELRCDIADGLAAVDGDCDDGDDLQYPGAIRYLDRDRDGFGIDDDAVVSCATILGRSLDGGDCDDRDPQVYPGAPVEVPYDFVDTDCDGGTDVPRTANGYPLPVGSWLLPPDWQAPPLDCAGVPAEHHVGPGQTHADIQSAIDAASACDIVVVHDGSYSPFTVSTRGLVITAEPGDEVTIWGGSQVLVEAADVILAGLTISNTTSGLRLEQSAFLDRVTMLDNLNNIKATGDLLAYDVEVKAGVGGLERTGAGNLRIVGATFSDILGIFGVLFNGGNVGQSVDLSNVLVTESTGGLFPAVWLSSEDIAIDGIAVLDGAGPAILLEGSRTTVQHAILRDNVVFEGSLFQVKPLLVVMVLVGERAVVQDLLVSENTWWIEDAASPAFVTVDDYAESFLDEITLAANVLDVTSAPASVRPVWLRATNETAGYGAGLRALHHITVAGYDAYGEGHPTGVGIRAEGGDLRQATIVGLDAALWSLSDDAAALSVKGSILWDNDALYLTQGGGLEPVFADCASNHVDATDCDSDDPRFLRYHPLLDTPLWDLRLFRDSPYYQYGGSSTPPATCLFDDPSLSPPGELQYGAYGDHSLVRADFALAGEVLPATDFFSDAYLYADCNNDLVYDSWAAQFQALDPAGDKDGDGLLNSAEFEGSTIPSMADTDDDGVDDGTDANPLDPTVQ